MIILIDRIKLLYLIIKAIYFKIYIRKYINSILLFHFNLFVYFRVYILCLGF